MWTLEKQRTWVFMGVYKILNYLKANFAGCDCMCYVLLKVVCSKIWTESPVYISRLQNPSSLEDL